MASQNEPPGRSRPSRSRSKQIRRPRILVVDDSADNREMYMEYLKLAGFGAIGAVDGATAVAAARTLHPAVVVMDLLLPGMDGLAATRILKADPATGDIVIFALTGRAEAATREQALSAGCDLFIAKPCSPAELVEHICRALDAAIDRSGSSNR